MKRALSVVALITATLSPGVYADQSQELVRLRNTVTTLVENLVQRGVLTREQGDALIRETLVEAAPAAPAVEDEKDKRAVRVPYVPEIVKDELREQLRRELREDVVEDVLAKAKRERWNAPGAWPAWVDRLTITGDFRLRYQEDDFAAGNAPYLNFQRINERRSIAIDDPFLNTTEDRERLRARLRLGVNAQLTQGFDIGTRLATGSLTDPVSTNQTLGNTSRPYQVTLDQAFLRYRSHEERFTVWGGRMPSPWFSTDLVWDDDLNFEGLAARYRRSPSMEADRPAFNPFLTAGIFPLQEVELSSSDKWLYGVQAGFDWRFARLSVFKLGLARYEYRNITGRRNDPGLRTLDYTAPQFMQKGNSLFRIDDLSDPNSQLWGLASDFEEINVTTSIDFGTFAPHHVVLGFDYVKNVGFDQQAILARTGSMLDERNEGYQVSLLFGRPRVVRHGEWNVFMAHKHLESDAVVDAFTDSDFHLGGTDAEGWVVGGNYAIGDNIWVNVRYLSTDAIHGPPLGIDTLQFDLNARF